MTNDTDQFWTLIEPEHFSARAFCRKLTGNRDDGDDLYQDALVAALKGFPALKEEKAFTGWLYRIIINTCKNRRRNPWWKKITSLTAGMEIIFSTHDPRPRVEAGRKLEAVLKVLSAEDRALITLFELQNWTVADLAEMMQLSEVNVRVRLHRIRNRMRKILLRDLNRPVIKTGTELTGVKKGYALSRSTEKID